jgi:glucose-1-phosphate thymidylyltransferase
MVINVMEQRSGIVLAGGTGSRLLPLTVTVNKHFLPVFDKPMIDYSLSLLMLGGITYITIVCRDQDLHAFSSHLGDGRGLGINLSFSIQEAPGGIPDAMLAVKRAYGRPVSVVLGDNFLAGGNLKNVLRSSNRITDRCHIFTYLVKDPERFGVVKRGMDNKILGIVEKPAAPPTNEAVIGLYNFPKDWDEHCKKINPSSRSELEIVDLINSYIAQDRLDCKSFGRGYSWLDMGNAESLFEASTYVEMIQRIQGLPLGLLPEIAWNNGWISKSDLAKLAQLPMFHRYKDYLIKFGGVNDA